MVLIRIRKPRVHFLVVRRQAKAPTQCSASDRPLSGEHGDEHSDLYLACKSTNPTATKTYVSSGCGSSSLSLPLGPVSFHSSAFSIVPSIQQSVAPI